MARTLESSETPSLRPAETEDRTQRCLVSDTWCPAQLLEISGGSQRSRPPTPPPGFWVWDTGGAAPRGEEEMHSLHVRGLQEGVAEANPSLGLPSFHTESCTTGNTRRGHPSLELTVVTGRALQGRVCCQPLYLFSSPSNHIQGGWAAPGLDGSLAPFSFISKRKQTGGGSGSFCSAASPCLLGQKASGQPSDPP